MENEKSPVDEAKPADPKRPGKDFLTVGIGASAGGIRALKEFFSAMPEDSGMAFVVVLHLSQTHESNLPAVLQRVTGMPVVQVSEPTRVEPNRVYVIPPAKNLEMVDGVVRLTDRARPRGQRVAIDRFFRTLADACRESAVGIVLSGAGEDGTLGIKHIKETNGFAVVQQPEDAEFDQMPRSAISTGLVDWILPVARMPEKLLALRRSTEELNLTDDDGKFISELKGAEALRDILSILRVRTGHDFASYKQPTLLRRIARHLQIYELSDLPSYVKVLREKPDEAEFLIKNLLINVTNFFRDHPAFLMLETDVVPRLFAGRTAEDQVRVWSAGCATGEEAYSLAILFAEYAAKTDDTPKIQIFASDVDDEAIARAREGVYPEGIAGDISPARLKRFFIREGKNYRVKKELREMVLFAPHNVLRDPPFSRLDLIVCRNMLIYFTRETQENLLHVFHFALRPDGFLFLGGSESPDSVPLLFSQFDKRQRIYLRRPTSPMFTAPWDSLPNRDRLLAHPDNAAGAARGEGRALSFGELHYRLLEKFAPPSALVNEEYEIVHLSENAGRFLQFVGGEPTNNLLKVAHPDLRADLRAVLFTAKQEHRRVESRGVPVETGGGEKRYVNLTAFALETADATGDFILVIMEDAEAPPPPAAAAVSDETRNAARRGSGRLPAAPDARAMDALARRLEEELRRTKDRLRVTVEQYDTSIEELKAANEELQAMNEELRSATEELETSKEELQSVNEEVTTVNHELKEKTEELSAANSDLRNLMHSTDIATIFLDRELRIKRFTHSVQEIFNIIQTDIGRPLEHFTHSFNYRSFTEDARQVLRTLRTVERELKSENKSYLVRLLPYRTTDDKIDGVVISFIDISERKRAEEVLAEELQNTQLLRDIGARLAFEGDDVRLYEKILEAAVALTGADAGMLHLFEEKTRDLVMFAARGFEPEFVEQFHRIDAGSKTSCGIALATGVRSLMDYDAPGTLDVEGSSKRYREAGFHSAQSTPLVSRSGKAVGMLSTHWREARHRPNERQLRFLDLLARQAADLIEHRQSEERLRESHRQTVEILESISDAFYAVDKDFNFTYVNKKTEELWGRSRDTLVGKHYWTEFPKAVGSETYKMHYRALEEQSALHYETISPLLGEWIDVSIYPNAGGGLSCYFRDVTERKRSEEALRESEERLRLIMENAEDYAILTLDAEGRYTDWNTGAENIFGYSREEAVGQPTELIFTPEDREKGVHLQELETARREGRAADERYHLRKDGSRLYVSGVMMALNEGGKLLGFAKIARDLTERRRMEDTLKEADRRKDEFLATLAHELRNPLAPIRSGVEIIRRGGQDEATMKKVLDIMERQTGQITHLVDDLLEISRITQGKIKLRRAPMNLKTAVDQARDATREILDKAGHEFTCKLPDEPVYVDGDLTRVTQIFQNLLSNAGRYTPPGGKIWLTGKTENGEAVVSVRDTGIGIPPAMQSKIFEMFSQIENPAEQARGGLGIGLSIVKKLAEMHGGTVSAFSEGEGKGSEFVVRLPLAADDGQDGDDGRGRRRANKPPPAPAAGEKGNGPKATPEEKRELPEKADAGGGAGGRDRGFSEAEKALSAHLKTKKAVKKTGASGDKTKSRRILVLDDNADAANMLKVLLTPAGHEVRVAYDAESGIETARGFLPEVCLLDIGLPEMDGYEAARHLREFLPEALMISVSGWGQEEDRRLSKEAGFDYHLVKPVEIEDINTLLVQSA